MRIASIHLKDFKRFKDVLVSGIPATARLVVVTGSNGSGKSGLLDALNFARRSRYWGAGDAEYYNKIDADGRPSVQNHVDLKFHDPQPADLRSAIWVRSAYRHEAEFSMPGINRQAPATEDPGVDRLVVGDRIVSANYVRLVSSSLELFFDQANRDKTAGELTSSLVGALQGALSRIFTDLQLRSLSDPLSDGTFFFDKGTSSRFPFKNLSGGERAAFDLLLDFAVRSGTFADTVFAIDEPELHLGSRVQAQLLDELLGLMSRSSQLWIATHSPGMMKRALGLYEQDPGSVAFLDTFGYEFDVEQQWTPIEPTRAFWRRALEVALDDMAELVAPRQVVLCESVNLADGFDATCYRQIFRSTRPDTEFLSVGNSHEVRTDQQGVAAAITVLAPGTEVLRLVDRDDKSLDEIAALRVQGVRVLSLRNLESYLFADEVIQLVCAAAGKPDELVAALAEKRRLLEHSVEGGGASDDLKKIGRSYRAWLQRRLNLPGTGGTTQEFARTTIIPLIAPNTETYKLLESDLFS